MPKEEQLLGVQNDQGYQKGTLVFAWVILLHDWCQRNKGRGFNAMFLAGGVVCPQRVIRAFKRKRSP